VIRRRRLRLLWNEVHLHLRHRLRLDYHGYHHRRHRQRLQGNQLKALSADCKEYQALLL
jgi:hypothetical protein